MKRLGMIIGSVSILLLFSGCTTEPEFNPNSKRIEFIDGKPYRLPYGVGRHSGPVSNNSTDRKIIERYRKAGINCKQGDIRWLELSSYDEFKKIHAEKISEDEKKQKKILLEQRLIKSGKLGCSSPLSDREYHFYQNQENQDAANRRAAAAERSAALARAAAYSNARSIERAAEKNRQAAEAASNVNVNISGTVTHDVQHSGTVYHNVDYYTPNYRY